MSDRLRELLLSEEAEHAGLYSAEEKEELLWRIFEHLVLGGACNQFEVGLAVGARTSQWYKLHWHKGRTWRGASTSASVGAMAQPSLAALAWPYGLRLEFLFCLQVR